MILVVGATGRVGRQIVLGLLERREHVRVLVRARAHYADLLAAGAEPALGDLKDPTSLVGALHGVHIVISTASAGERGGADTPQTVDLEGHRNLIDAARHARVQRFVFISTIAASEDSPAPLPRMKALTQKYLSESGLEYTILAADLIAEVNFPLIIDTPLRAGRAVTFVGEARRRHTPIASRDLAAFAVAVARHPAAANRRIPLGGPQAVSWRDIIAIYERVLGRAIPVRTIAPGELLPDVASPLRQLLSGLLAALEMFDSEIDMTETALTYGVRLTALEQVVDRSLAELPPASA